MSKVIGLTGSIAVGKSTVTHYLLNHGYQVIDADILSHQALSKGTSSYQRIIDTFDCMNEDGDIDRQKLGQIVFYDSKKKKMLEDIIHPYVIEHIKKGIECCQDDLIFLDIPLLFEVHWEFLCDKIIVVYVDETTQIQRLMKRNHISLQAAIHLVQQQISIEDKKNRGDYILNNNQNFEDLYKDIERVLKVIQDEVIHE